MKRIIKLLSIVLLMFALMIKVSAVAITTNSTAGTVNTAKMTYSNDPYGSGTMYVTDTAAAYTHME